MENETAAPDNPGGSRQERGTWRGWLTKTDGQRVPLSKEEAETIWRATAQARSERAERLPTQDHAIKAMFEAYDRLRELGWKEIIYCPKDGSAFEVIEAGSTGIFRCHYEGEWPDGSWWIEDAGDLWPARPILFRRIKEPG